MAVVLIASGALGYVAAMRAGEKKRDLGRRGEQTAERFLSGQRYEIIARNYRCAVGEIDLVARDHDTFVFVEVRTQTGPTFGDPLDSVTLRKQRQIAKTAMYYAARHRLDNQPLRFDVIGIRWEGETPHITHVKEAFVLPDRAW